MVYLGISHNSESCSMILNRLPTISNRPQWYLAKIVQEFNTGLVPLPLAEKDQGCVSFPSTNEECAKLVGLPPGKSILRRWFICAWIENLSCGTDKLLLFSPLNIHSSLLSRSCPRKCCILPTAVSGCFCSLLCLIWKRRRYLADMLVKFLIELEREHSAPANEEILSEGVNWW